jgi:hypothetical protein
MRNSPLTLAVLGATLAVTSSCGRNAMLVPQADASPSGGAGLGLGTLVALLPDGGLAALLGDGGLAQIVCGPKVRLGTPCSDTTPACVLSSLGGICACVSGSYVCPLNTGAPKPCPPGAATGTSCMSPLSTCFGGSTNGCLCGLGTYTCL